MLHDIPDDWQHADIDKALTFVRKFDLGIDAGAHRGVVTRKLAQHFDGVVAIEPGPLADQIEGAEVIRAAIGDKPGHCDMADGKHNTGQRHCVPGDGVEVITLDSLGLAPDFLKLDVEGMEYHALLGAEQTIRTHKPVVMLEENGLNRRYGIEDNACKRLLESWGARHVLTMESNPPDTDQVFAWPTEAAQIIRDAFGDKDDPFAFANEVLRIEAPKYGITHWLPPINECTPVSVETWSVSDILGMVATAAECSSILAFDGVQPRRTGGTIIYADVGNKLVLLDGRHRSWVATDPHEVAILALSA